VDLKSGQFVNTQTKTSMLVFQKGVGATDTIRFIDAEESTLAVASLQQVRAKSHRLELELYVERAQVTHIDPTVEMVALGDIAEIRRGTVIEEKDKGTMYPAYGGDLMAYKVDAFNRVSMSVVARHNCVMKIHGQGFCSGDALTVHSLDPARARWVHRRVQRHRPRRPHRPRTTSHKRGRCAELRAHLMNYRRKKNGGGLGSNQSEEERKMPTGIGDVPHGVLVQILESVDYDLAAAGALMRVDRRFRGAVLDERRAAKLVAKELLTKCSRGWSQPRSAYYQLNVGRILDIVATGREGLKGALRSGFLAIARTSGTLAHDALLVRAPLIMRAARQEDASAHAARVLFTAMRPSVVRTILSERIGETRVYGDLSEAEMARVVDGIGCHAFTNRYTGDENGGAPVQDGTFRGEVAAYITECRAPLGARRVLATRGPLCFWDTSGIEDLGHAFDHPELYWPTALLESFSAGGPVTKPDYFSADLMWPTQNVINMSRTFAHSGFNGRIGHWNVARVRRMYATFMQNPVFNQPIGAWDVGRVQNMNHMLRDARAFNQPIAAWNVAAVRERRDILTRAVAFKHPLPAWQDA
jgi:hypothetical protein